MKIFFLTKTVRFFVFSFLFLSSFIARSFQSRQTLEIDFEQAKEAFLEKSLKIQMLKEQISQADLDIAIAASAKMPTASIGAQIQNSGQIEKNDYKHDPFRSSLSLKSSLSIYSSGSVDYQIQKKQILFEKAKQDFLVAQNSELINLENLFYRLLYEQENQVLLGKIAMRLEKQKHLMQLKYQSGSEAKWALLKAVSDYQASLEDKNQSIKSAKFYENQIKNLLQIDPSKDLAVKARFDALLQKLNLPKDDFYANHPLMLSFKYDLESSTIDERIESKKDFLSIDAFAGYKKDFDKAQKNGYGSVSYGIEMNLPLFVPSKSDTLRKLASISRVKERAFLLKRLELQTDLENKIKDYEQLVRTIEVNKQRLEAAVARSLTTEQEYAAGLKNFVDWEQAENQLIELEKKNLLTLLNVANALQQIKLASCGNLP